jgi:cyanate permease
MVDETPQHVGDGLLYGAKSLGTGLGYGLSGIVGPLTGGWLFDTTSSYGPAITVAAVLTTVSAGVLALRHRRPVADPA